MLHPPFSPTLTNAILPSARVLRRAVPAVTCGTLVPVLLRSTCGELRFVFFCPRGAKHFSGCAMRSSFDRCAVHLGGRRFCFPRPQNSSKDVDDDGLAHRSGRFHCWAHCFSCFHAACGGLVTPIISMLGLESRPASDPSVVEGDVQLLCAVSPRDVHRVSHQHRKLR